MPQHSNRKGAFTATANSIIEGTSLRIAPDDFPNPTVDIPLASPGAPPATAVLAGGCFWCTEAVYRQLDGVLAVAPGYAGGTRETADYETVCTGRTKHAEAIRITYDAARITYGQLLKVFFSVAHDPTQLNRQGADVGTQYRSAVFSESEQQRTETDAFIAELSKTSPKPIVTQVVPLETFFPAEDYHKQYYQRNPGQSYCLAVVGPKVAKARKQFAHLLKPAA